MVSANQVREVIMAYAQNGEAGAFVLEFSKLAFGIDQHGDRDAIQLVKAVEARIAMVHAGHLSQASLREWLLALEAPTRIVVAQPMIFGDFSQYESGSSVNPQVAEKVGVFPLVFVVKQEQHETAPA